MRVAVTGHQPALLGGFGDEVALRLKELAAAWIGRERPSEIVSGMAAGWDMAVAAAAVECGVPLVAALACPGQNRGWPDEARERFDRLLARAELVHVMPGGAGMWGKRDAWVITRGERVLALWSGADGGTARAVARAVRLRKPVENLWADWVGLAMAA